MYIQILMWDREAGPGPRYKKYIFVYKSAGTEDTT